MQFLGEIISLVVAFLWMGSALVSEVLSKRWGVFVSNVWRMFITTLFIAVLCWYFLGAPYPVYAWYKGCKPLKEKNIQFMASMKLDYLPGAAAVIHDGNDYIFHQALAMGIPQMIVSGGGYLRSYNAQTAKRQNFGVVLQEENLSMSSLYETYRKLVSDDVYYDNTRWLMTKYEKEGDLNALLQYL